MKIFLLVFLSFLLSCKNQSRNEFKVISFDWSRDYFKDIAKGFNPISDNNWAFLKYGLNNGQAEVLYQKGEILQNNESLVYDRGFYYQGHSIEWYYYIVSIENDSLIYITDKNKLLKFLGDIDTMEEAFLLTILSGFIIDSNNPKGGSYSKTDEGYDFLLIKRDISSSIVDLNSIEYRQYLVNVDIKGNVKSEAREIYCRGYEECEGLKN